MAHIFEPALRQVEVAAVQLDNLVIEAVRAAKRAAARGHEPDPAVFRIDHFLKVKQFVILGRQLLQRDEGANPVFYDLSVFFVADVGNAREIASGFQGAHIVAQGVLAFADKNGIKEARSKHLLRRDRGMNAAADNGRADMLFYFFSHLYGKAGLVGDQRKRNDIRAEGAYVRDDAGKVKGIPELFVDIEQPCCMAGLLEHRREIGDAVVEADLGVEIGIDEKYFHGEPFRVYQRLVVYTTRPAMSSAGGREGSALRL